MCSVPPRDRTRWQRQEQEGRPLNPQGPHVTVPEDRGQRNTAQQSLRAPSGTERRALPKPPTSWAHRASGKSVSKATLHDPIHSASPKSQRRRMSSGCRGQGTGTGAVDGRGAAGGDLCGGGAALHLDSGRGPRDPHAPRDSCTRPPRQGHTPDLSCTLSGCTVRGAGLGSSRSPRWEVGVKVGRLYPGTHFWPRRCPPGAPLQQSLSLGDPGVPGAAPQPE